MNLNQVSTIIRQTNLPPGVRPFGVGGAAGRDAAGVGDGGADAAGAADDAPRAQGRPRVPHRPGALVWREIRSEMK